VQPLALELSPDRGILEPLQTADTIDGQVGELKTVLEEADSPMTLVGHSWGAWLGYILAARHPPLVKRLILVSSGGFDEKYAPLTQETRLSRLDDEGRREVARLMELFSKNSAGNGDGDFARIGEIFSKVDAYDPLPQGPVEIEFSLDIFRRVWGEATELRRSGRLLEMGKDIACPVTAIHGDYDPHPAKGVEGPLSSVLRNFRFILLKNCGHKPWIERRAKERFLVLLEEELNAAE
jgi:pimeloyl-ACP methyl ester carboxylesterase